MTTEWWVIGDPSKTQFVSWSCGTLSGLEDAAVYRSEINAIKKIKALLNYDPKHYANVVPHKIKVTV